MSGIDLNFNFGAPADFDPNDYTSDASVKSINDPRFLRDLRDFYGSRGVQGSDEQLISRWKSDNRWRETNVAYTAIEAGRAATQSQMQAEREARLARVWNAMPNFWEEGGDGFLGVVGDYAGAILTDPTNLIPGAAAVAPARIAATRAAAAGQNAVRAGIAAGAGRAAVVEGGINTAVGGAQSLLEQSREVNLGMADGVSGGRLAADAALSGAFGAGVGGVIGGTVGGFASRGAADRASQLAGRFTPDEIGRLTQPELDAALADPTALGGVARQAQIDAEQSAADVAREAQVAERAQATPAQRDAWFDRTRIASYELELEDRLAEANARHHGETDPARRDLLAGELNELVAQRAALEEITSAEQRIAGITARINKLIEDPSGKSNDEIRRLRETAIRLRTDARTLFDLDDSEAVRGYLSRLATLEEELGPVTPAATPTPAAQTPGTTPVDPTAAPAAAAPTTAINPAPEPTPATGRRPGRPRVNPEAAAPAAPAADAAVTPAAAPTPEPAAPAAPPARVRHSKPVLDNAIRQGVDPDKLPEGATVADVESAARDLRSRQVGVDPDLDRDATTLERVFAELDEMIPDEVKRELNIFRNKDFLEKVLKADERTAGNYERYRDIWNASSSKDDPQLEMRVSNKSLEKAVARRINQEASRLMREQNLSPEAAREQARLSLENRNAQGPEDRPRGMSTQGDRLERGGVFITPDQRLQPFLMPGTRMSDASGTITRETSRLEGTRFGNARRLLEIPSERLFSYEAAVTRGRNSIETAARLNAESAARAEAKARAALQSFLKKQDAAGLSSNPDSLEARRVYTDALAAANAEIVPKAGFDIVQFRATGSEKLAGGRAWAKRGDTVFIDVLSGKAYPSLESLYKRRGLANPDQAAARTIPTLDAAFVGAADAARIEEARPISRAEQRQRNRAAAAEQRAAAQVADAPTLDARPYAPIYEAINRFLSDGNLASLRATLTKFITPEDATPQPRRQPTTSRGKTQPANTVTSISPDDIPGMKDGKVLILVPKDTTDKPRLLSAKRARDGVNASSLLRSSESLADFDAIYLSPSIPVEQRMRQAAQWRNQQTAGPQTAPASEVVPETPPAPRTPAPLTMSSEQFDAMTIDISPTEREAIVAAYRMISPRSAAGVEQTLEGLNGEGLRLISVQLEANSTFAWPGTLDAYRARISALEAVYGIESRHAPVGVALPSLERQVAVDQIRRIFTSYPADLQKRVIKNFERLVGDRPAPLIGIVPDDNPANGIFRPTTNSLLLPRNEKRLTYGQPAELVMTHEMGHWAYFNVLTPADRLEFWRTLEKFYDPQTGALDTKALRALTPDPRHVPGALSSPQEYFANAFTAYALGRVAPDTNELSFWQRIAGYAQALYDWFIARKPIDPNLVPLFSKILPPDEMQRVSAIDNYTPRSPEYDDIKASLEESAVRARELRARAEAELQTSAEPRDDTKRKQSIAYNWNTLYDPEGGLVPRWEEAIRTQNWDALISAAEDTASYLGGAFRSAPTATDTRNHAMWLFKGLEPEEGARRGAKTYSRWPLGRSRIEDINRILAGGRSEKADGTLIVDKERLGRQLEQLWYYGHFTPQSRIDAGFSTYVTERSPTADQLKLLEDVPADRFHKWKLPSGAKPGWVGTDLKYLMKDLMRTDIEMAAGRIEGLSIQPGTRLVLNERVSPVSDARVAAATDAVRTPTPEVARRPPTTPAPNTSGIPAPANAPDRPDPEAINDGFNHIAVLRSRATEPTPPAGVDPEILSAAKSMREDALHKAYARAQASGNTKDVTLYGYEIQRRAAAEAPPVAKPETPVVAKSMNVEQADYAGRQTDIGVPPAARPAIQQIVASVTMRSPENDAAARTLTYRLFNLAAFTPKGEDASLITRSAIARLAGGTVDPESAEMPWSPQGDEFNTLRRQVRRLTSALNDGNGDPREAAEALVRMAARTFDADVPRSAIDTALEVLSRRMTEADADNWLASDANPGGSGPTISALVDRARYLAEGNIGRAAIKEAFPDLALGAPRPVTLSPPLMRAFVEPKSGRVLADIAADVVSQAARVSPYHLDHARLWTGEPDPSPYFATSRGPLKLTPPGENDTNFERVLRTFLDTLSPQAADDVRTLLARRQDAVEGLRAAMRADKPDERAINSATQAVRKANTLLENMTRDQGMPALPSVQAYYIKKVAIAPLDESIEIEAGDPMVTAIIRRLVERNDISDADGARIISQVEGRSGAFLLETLEGMLTARQLQDALSDIGYHGHRDRADGVHIYNQADLLSATGTINREPTTPTHLNMRGALGDLVEAAMATNGPVDNMGLAADELALRINAAPLIDNALTIIGKKRDPRTEDLVELRRGVGWPGLQIASNSARARKIGANHLADFFENHFPEFNERLGRRLADPQTGLLNLLHNVDGENWAKRWARKATPFFTLGQATPRQPAAHANILLALRNPSGSMFERRLKADERPVYVALRQAMRDEFRKLRTAGVPINDRGPDYFPQVWSADAIRANLELFEQAMLGYLRVEADRLGRAFDPAEARKTATDIRLGLSEDVAGDAIADTMGMGRNPIADHIDFARLIDLDANPEARANLEPFLESDLEAMVTKYFDSSTRRLMFHERFGMNARGFYDYVAVAIEGREMVEKLLQTDMEFHRTSMRMGDGGFVVDERMRVDRVIAPFEGRPDLAKQFTDRLVETVRTRGAPAGQELLYSLMREPGGDLPANFKARADAIVGALADYSGEKGRLHRDEEQFLYNTFAASMRRPLSSSQTAMDASRYLRTFNSVTLLGFTMLNSMGDLVLPLIRGGEMRAYTRAWSRYSTDREYRRLLGSVGVTIENAVQEHMLHLTGSAGTRWGQAFFYANGLTPWTNTMRKISAGVGYETFVTMQDKAARHYKAGQPLQQQPPEYKKAYRFLRHYGLEDYADKRINTSLSNRELLASDQKLRVAINKFSDQAIFQPNPNDIPIWAQTPLGAIFFQLKAFPLMMQRLARDIFIKDGQAMVQAWREDGFNGALHNLPKRAALMLSVAPALGAGTLAMNDVVRGRGGEENKQHDTRVRNLNNFLGGELTPGQESDFLGWYFEGLMLAGGFGLLADLFHKSAQQADNGAFGQNRVASGIFGPTFGTFMSAYNVAAGTGNAILDFDPSNASDRTAVREVVGRIPFVGGLTPVREAIVDGIAGTPNPYQNLR